LPTKSVRDILRVPRGVGDLSSAELDFVWMEALSGNKTDPCFAVFDNFSLRLI